MDSFLSIGITALATLLVTIIGGITLDRIKRIKPKIKYSIKGFVPIPVNDLKIGASVIKISNPSSTTVKELVIKIKSSLVDNIRNGGVSATPGLDYELEEHKNDIEIKVPFLKYNDYLSITAISEDRHMNPREPEISIRSPDTFKLLEEVDNPTKNSSSIDYLIGPAIVAGGVVLIALMLFNANNPRNDQGATLAIAASIVGASDLATLYVSNEEVNYYNQAPIAYSLAKVAKDKNEIKRYGDFLEVTMKIKPRMNSASESALCFFTGKIRELEGKKNDANKWFERSQKLNKKEYAELNSFLSEINNK